MHERLAENATAAEVQNALLAYWAVIPVQQDGQLRAQQQQAERTNALAMGVDVPQV
jgi:hypothetical protein